LSAERAAVCVWRDSVGEETSCCGQRQEQESLCTRLRGCASRNPLKERNDG